MIIICQQQEVDSIHDPHNHYFFFLIIELFCKLVCFYLKCGFKVHFHLVLSEILAQSMLGDSATPLWAKIKSEASVSLFFCRSRAVICVFVCAWLTLHFLLMFHQAWEAIVISMATVLRALKKILLVSHLLDMFVFVQTRSLASVLTASQPICMICTSMIQTDRNLKNQKVCNS